MNNTAKQKTIIGVDLGDRKHAICVTDKDGNILKEYFITNTPHSLKKLAQEYPESLVAIEVGTHSPWISRLLTDLGCEVIVANARKLRAIYTNERKCDELDARMLAKIARLDPELLHPIQHGSEECQRDMAMIRLRDSLTRQRVNLILSIRATLKSLGMRLKASSSAAFADAAREQLKEDVETLCLIHPVLRVIDELTLQIKDLNKRINQTISQKYQEAERLQKIPGIGPITALSFVLHIEKAERFENIRDIGAYLGLVPRRDQSGKIDKQLPISKTGDKYLRTLLVQAAQYILGHFGPDCDLRRKGLELAAKGGRAAKRKAVIATARKLSVVMLSMWQNNSDYEPLKKNKAA